MNWVTIWVGNKLRMIFFGLDPFREPADHHVRLFYNFPALY
jgi:hypothetical protein